ncbi:MAG: hypothetical protein RBR33_07980 [Sulfurovaceae bacterium]|nr:hypothetical protein [Sulfurovaceae bacterium]
MENITALQGAVLSDKVYNDLSSYVDTDKTISDGFDNSYYVLEFLSDQTTDLQMALYQNTVTGNYVVAFRGTESVADWITDAGMGVATLMEGLEASFTIAGVTLASWIGNPDYNLSPANTTIVGHSLGGSLAQYFGATTGFETLTYNALSIGIKVEIKNKRKVA